MEVLLQTSRTGVEDDDFSLTATSPLQTSNLLRSLYCHRKSVSPNGGILNRMGRAMTGVSLFEIRDSFVDVEYHENVQ